MLEYLTPSANTYLRIGTTGNLEGSNDVVSSLTYRTHIGYGWFNLHLPEKPSSIYTATEENAMVVGKDSGSVYTINFNNWDKLPPPPHPVAKVFCDDFGGEHIITDAGDLFSFSRTGWSKHSSPFPLIDGCTFISITAVINNQGQLYVMGNNEDGRIGLDKKGNYETLTYCPVPDNELVTNVRIGFTEDDIGISIITTSSGKVWRAEEEGWTE